MSDALLLFLALPQSYFATITLHFTGWYLSLIPASGAVSLLIGVALAIVRKEKAAWWTLLPISLSQFLVVLAGLFRGQLTATEWVLLPFVALQVGLSTFIVVYCRQSRVAAIFLAWFSFSYALNAAFIAAMAFADSWI